MTLTENILKIFIREEIDQVTETEKRTFFLDTVRSGVDGIETTLAPSVFLLIAIRFFHASDLWKSIISSSIFVGLIISLFSSSFFAHKKPTVISGIFTILSGLLLMALGFAQTAVIFSIFVLFQSITLFIRPPLLTAIYESNYAPSRRARLYSAGILFAIITGLLSNYLFGMWLEINLENFRWIFIISGFLFLISGFLLINIPYSPERKPERKNPLKNQPSDRYYINLSALVYTCSIPDEAKWEERLFYIELVRRWKAHSADMFMPGVLDRLERSLLGSTEESLIQ